MIGNNMLYFVLDKDIANFQELMSLDVSENMNARYSLDEQFALLVTTDYAIQEKSSEGMDISALSTSGLVTKYSYANLIVLLTGPSWQPIEP